MFIILVHNYFYFYFIVWAYTKLIWASIPSKLSPQKLNCLNLKPILISTSQCLFLFIHTSYTCIYTPFAFSHHCIVFYSLSKLITPLRAQKLNCVDNKPMICLFLDYLSFVFVIYVYYLCIYSLINRKAKTKALTIVIASI